MTNVSFLGLGRMGAPMATKLVRTGHDVTVWNRTAAKAEAFVSEVGGQAARTPREAVSGAEVVISMVADDAALRGLYHGSDGVLAGITDGAVAVDMSTVSPGIVAELADHLEARGLTFHDAPVSGSVQAATDGTLTIMVGGELAPRTSDVLDAIGAAVIPLGPTGTGAAMKLAVNAIVHALNGAVAESLVLAERAGIQRRLAYDVLERSAVAAPFVRYRRTSFLDPDRTPVAFLLSLAAKDLRLARDLADQVGAELPQTTTNLAVLEKAADAGFSDQDETALANYFRHQVTRGVR